MNAQNSPFVNTSRTIVYDCSEDEKNNADYALSSTTSTDVFIYGKRDEQGRRKTFPMMLQEVLASCEAHGDTHIASWHPHGRSFRIHKPKEFAKAIMPKIFRQSKWSSFQRQLNLYGFKRITGQTDERGSYYHEFFLKNKIELAQKMKRVTVKGTQKRRPGVPHEKCPDFYSMPPVDPATSLSDHCIPTILQNVDDSKFATASASALRHSATAPWTNPIIIQPMGSEPQSGNNIISFSHAQKESKNEDDDCSQNEIDYTLSSCYSDCIPSGDHPVQQIPANNRSVETEPCMFSSTDEAQVNVIGCEIKRLLRILDQNEDNEDIQENKNEGEHPSPSPVFSDDSFGMKLPDEPYALQKMYESIGKPFAFDQLNALPRDDAGWGDFLQRLFE